MRPFLLAVLLTIVPFTAGLCQVSEPSTPGDSPASSPPDDAPKEPPDRLSLLEERLELALELRDSRLDQIQSLFNIVVGAGGIFLVFLTGRDILQRRSESARQERIDNLVSDIVGQQKTLLQHEAELRSVQASKAESSVSTQIAGLRSVNEVLDVVARTLTFRAEQEATIEKTRKEVEEALAGMKTLLRRDDARFSMAVSIAEQFIGITRMDLPALPDELIQRGRQLRQIVGDVSDFLESSGKRAAVGDVYYWAGVLAYYDNSVAEARRYLDLSVGTRAERHDELIQTDRRYRFRVAFTYHFRGILEKNWGDLAAALEDLETSAAILKPVAGELLTPVTRAEILSVTPGSEVVALTEIRALLKKVANLERSKKKEGKRLDANQEKLRERLHLLEGNVLVLGGQDAEALLIYEKTLGRNPNHYYALGAAGQCLSKLGRQDEATDTYQRCLAALESSGDLLKKRELVTRVGLSALGAAAAHGLQNDEILGRFRGELERALGRKLEFDGMTPKFFSPIRKRLVVGQELLGEVLGLEVGLAS